MIEKYFAVAFISSKKEESTAVLFHLASAAR